REGPGMAIATGALLSAATWYKHHTVVYAVFLIVVHLVDAWSSTQDRRRRAAVDVCFIAAVGIVTWGGLFTYLFATGRLERAWTTFVSFPSFYSGNMTQNLIRALTPSVLMPAPLRPIWSSLGLMALVGLLLDVLTGRVRRWAYLIAYGLAT